MEPLSSLLLSTLLTSLGNPYQAPPPKFDLQLNPDHLMSSFNLNDMRLPSISPIRDGILFNHYFGPWANIFGQDGMPRLSDDKKTYIITLDVKQFKPEEVKVKVADGFIDVVAKHELKNDDRVFVSKVFIRKFMIPSEVSPNQITWDIKDGVLTIKAPWNADSSENEIPNETTKGPEAQEPIPTTEKSNTLTETEVKEPSTAVRDVEEMTSDGANQDHKPEKLVDTETKEDEKRDSLLVN